MARAARRPRSLQAEEIVAAGLRIAREDDLRRLTMKRLGDELGVTSMALYRHFRGKAELIDGILEAFMRDAAPTRHGHDPGDWREWTRRTFSRVHRALVQTPGVMAYLGSGWRFGDEAITVLDESLAVLHGAGLSRREAVESFAALIAFTIGCAASDAALASDEEPGEERGERRRRLRLRLASASRASHPHVVEHAAELAALAARRSAFDAGLERVLDGIALRVPR